MNHQHPLIMANLEKSLNRVAVHLSGGWITAISMVGWTRWYTKLDQDDMIDHQQELGGWGKTMRIAQLKTSELCCKRDSNWSLRQPNGRSTQSNGDQATKMGAMIMAQIASPTNSRLWSPIAVERVICWPVHACHMSQSETLPRKTWKKYHASFSHLGVVDTFQN